jgi:hypothetical protein
MRLLLIPAALCLTGLFCASGTRAFDEIIPDQAKSIDRGIQWLIKAQNKDGSWGMDLKTPPNVSATAIAGLALLASGSTDREGADPAAVRALKSCVAHLLKRGRSAKKGRDIADGEHSEVQTYVGHMAPTFYAVIFLSQIYGNKSLELSVESMREMKEVLEKLTDTIALSQDADGSWFKNTYSSLQGTCLAWMALRSANSAGIPIKAATIEKTLKFIRAQYNPGIKMFNAPGQRGASTQTIYATCSAIRILHGMGLWKEREDQEAMRTFLDKVAKGQWSGEFLTITGEDYPAALFMTHALIKEGGANWETWFGFVRAKLLKHQNADGSWTATSCLSGRTFATACAALCLQTPYRLLPLQDL